ncbi:MAG: metal ABC transporter substrate-binding protein [Verrucomicrobiota bacterium]
MKTTNAFCFTRPNRFEKFFANFINTVASARWMKELESKKPLQRFAGHKPAVATVETFLRHRFHRAKATVLLRKFFLTLGCVGFFSLSALARLNVVASTADFGAIAQEIGGDKVDVTTLAKPTEDPHFVDAKPSFIVKLNHADAVIEGGAELEVGWLPPLIDNSRNSKLESGKPGRIACAEGISLLEVPATLDRSKGDIHAAGNPHFMSDPLNGKIAAAHIANSFCQLDPKSCDYFKANLKKFNARLDAKMAEWQKLLAPDKGKDVVSYHDLWPYFARRFDLKMDIFLEPKPGIPPTPAHLAEVITKMKSENIKVIIVQPYQNKKTAETVANHAEATVVDFPAFPGSTKETQGYIEWLDFLVKSLSGAFEQKK